MFQWYCQKSYGFYDTLIEQSSLFEFQKNLLGCECYNQVMYSNRYLAQLRFYRLIVHMSITKYFHSKIVNIFYKQFMTRVSGKRMKKKKIWVVNTDPEFEIILKFCSDIHYRIILWN